MEKSEIQTIKITLIVIAIGVWGNLLFNILSFDKTKRVEVENGVRVRGSVDIDNTVDVRGSVDVNISEINGKNNVFYQDTDGDYILLPVHPK